MKVRRRRTNGWGEGSEETEGKRTRRVRRKKKKYGREELGRGWVNVENVERKDK